MFFINKDQVDKDVEKIREYTLGPEHLEKKLIKEAEDTRRRKENTSEFTWKDVLAMTIAIIQVILPFLIIFVLAMSAAWFFFWYMAHH